MADPGFVASGPRTLNAMTDWAAIITASAGLVTAAGSVVAIVLTRRTVKGVGEKLDVVHELVNSKSERDAAYQVQLVELLKDRGIDVPTQEPLESAA